MADADPTELATAAKKYWSSEGYTEGGVIREVDYATQSGFRMRPFVLWIEDETGLAPDPREVARIYRIPLAELASPALPTLHPVPHSEQPAISLRLPTIGDELHAPTGAILYQFREVAFAGRHTRVGHFAQPRFSWQ